MLGYIHSTESFGTVDGPGVRFVVFMQGCPMRCKYCHNPDTWKMNAGSVRSAKSLIDEYQRNEAFYAKGGITVTGGEALMQIDFLLELFDLAKKKGIHTCLDTSGVTYRPGQSSYNEKLDRLILLARQSTDQTYRKTLYKECLDIIADWAVEIPVYQRQSTVIFSAKRVNLSTLTPDMTTFWDWKNDIEKLEMK